MFLYRPVGLDELRLIYESGLAAFPPRLPEQPIFYPIFNFSYTEQIARDWNTKSPSRAGYVVRFEVDDTYIDRFEPHTVGSREHRELWVGAEELETFNSHILPPIRVVSSYFAEDFKGFVPEKFMLQGKDAVVQFVTLTKALNYSSFDFWCEVEANQTAVFLHYPFWKQQDFSADGVGVTERDRVLAAIEARWTQGISSWPLSEIYSFGS
jgi:hypothetical protein